MTNATRYWFLTPTVLEFSSHPVCPPVEQGRGTARVRTFEV